MASYRVIVEGRELGVCSGADKALALENLRARFADINAVMTIIPGGLDLSKVDLIEYVSDEAAGFPTVQ